MIKTKRKLLKLLTLGIISAPFIRGVKSNYKPKIIIVGGGFGGASFIRHFEKYNSLFEIILIEKEKSYYTCPFSNYVLGGFRKLNENKFNYDNIARRVSKVIHEEIKIIDSNKKKIIFNDRSKIYYDWLVLSPGVGFNYNINGYNEEINKKFPHCWSGKNIEKLNKSIDSLETKSKIIICAPDYPYKCPPAPYERASLIANRLKKKRLDYKIIILDQKNSFTKQNLFFDYWEKNFPNRIEWISQKEGGSVVEFDSKSKIVHTEYAGKFKGDLINIIPNQRAADLIINSELIKDDWCEINPITFGLKRNNYIHVIGDSINAWDMPKSGFSANSQARICAENLKNIILEKKLIDPVYLNTCYSLASENYGFSISSWFRVSSDKSKIVSLGSSQTNIGGKISKYKEEVNQSRGWYKNITNEMFG